jgi:hypothetical protein
LVLASAAFALGDVACAIPINMQVSTFEDIASIILGIALGFGVMMIMFFGIKMLISDEDRDRADAKKSMIQVGVGIVIIALAEALVTVFFHAPVGYS